jgi:hypothetical protein
VPANLQTARTRSLPFHHSGGAQSSVPIFVRPGRGTVLRACQFLRTARTPSLPLHHSGGAQSSVPQAGLPVPLCRAKTHPLGGAQSPAPVNSCGPRGRGPSHSRSFPFHHSGGARSSVPVYLIPGGAQSSAPVHLTPGGAQSSVPQAGLPVPRGRARTHPLGGARSSVPANFADREDAVPPIAPFGRGTVLCATGRIACATQQSENAPCRRGAVLCARKSLPPCLPILRTARTRSLPFHHSGGPQSPVPQAGLPVPLSGAKTYPLGGARCFVPANFCGPRGRGPSHCTIREGHGPLCPFSSAPGGARSSVPQAGLPVPLSRARTHPLGGAQSSVPVFVRPGRGTVLRACQFLRTARTRSLPLHHSRGARSSVPVFVRPGRGTVLCATGRIACATQQSENAPSGRGTAICARFRHPREGRSPLRPFILADGEDAVPPIPPPGRGTVLAARFRQPREGHGPLCHRQDCLCHSAERKRTL